MTEPEIVDDWEAEADSDDDGAGNPVDTTATTSAKAPVPPTVPVQSAAVESTPNGNKTLSPSNENDLDDVADDDGSGSSASDFEADGAKVSPVLNAYHRLLSRRVDLVGDYAGNELFFIDGDSLLLRAFEDQRLDFDSGFQLLHAVYNIEHFLDALIQRKCNFHIIFADSNQDLCIPKNHGSNAHKYRFARAAIIRHLSVNLVKVRPTVKVTTFSSYKSNEFSDYMEKCGPYFVMFHDGASATSRKGERIEQLEADSDPNYQRIALRQVIVHFIQQGYNVALLNGLEWRDTKVMTMVLERNRKSRMISIDLPTLSVLEQRPLTIDVDKSLATLTEERTDLTERQRLAILAIADVIRGKHEDFSEATLMQLSCLFLFHEALLDLLPLGQRRLRLASPDKESSDFLASVSASAFTILNSETWTAQHPDNEKSCDLADFVDGRLFFHLVESQEIESAAYKSFSTLLSGLEMILGTSVDASLPKTSRDRVKTISTANGASIHDLAVLPFSNPVFNKHLETVRLEVDDTATEEPPPIASKIFRELTHWHNSKRPIAKVPVDAQKDAKNKFWVDRRNQWFMAEMRTYAASLTNAVGKSLEPETIIEGTNKTKVQAVKKGTQSPLDSDASDSAASTKSKTGKSGGGKNAAKGAGKDAMLKQIAVDRAKKNEAAGGKIVSSWHTVCANLNADKSPKSRYSKAKNYLTSLQSAWIDVVGAEIQLYMLNELVTYWLECCKEQQQDQQTEVLALIWNSAGNILQSKGLTATIVKSVELAVKTLALPPVPSVSPEGLPDRKLPFSFALPTKFPVVPNKLSAKDFQLEYCGPYLERTFDSAPDDRVDFHPDGWQRKVLDCLDRDESVFVVAPTSAGKTFISFYAMRKVLERDSEGVIVYVAPTKALVNQIAAEIQARYSKNYKYGGKSVWAIHTRDYRINSPTGCQVLVTVPHVLQIMLLAPSNANSWSSRIRRIIFDEVHSIGQADDGVVWEQLLLLAPCPIVALSATVGNPGEFSSWLASTQEAIGQKLVTVQHPHRYSDLRKYFYVPPSEFHFGGVPDKGSFGTLSLDGVTNFNFVHPVAGLIDKSRGIPEDLALEPRDCFLLWQLMKKHSNKEFPIPGALDPNKALPAVIRKADILGWEKGLKDVLKQWISSPTSPYDNLVSDLGETFRSGETKEYSTMAITSPANPTDFDRDDLKKTTLPLLCRLHAQDALPAILFNYDRHMCEDICTALLQQLKDSETAHVKSGRKWEKTLEQWEEWKKIQAKAAAKKSKAPSKSKDKDDEKESKLDMQKDAGGQESSVWDSFDPDAPQPGYHFADHTKAQNSELQVYVRQLGRRGVPQYLIDGLARGVGIHHAGMNRKYRQIVEILFRKRFLRVIIATGTLALGINMPAKTVVFSGDSVFLTALNYRQCAGRAGRRGFDLLGNVVFQGVSKQKVCRLLSSRLPDLNGHFPITTTLVLRLFTLLHESKQSKYAVSAINALLSQPRLYLGGPSFKEATMHHLRFSIEYLRRQHLLDSRGASLNFAGLVSHLYFTENSAFAFHALVKGGYFHQLCAKVHQNEKATLETLMLVMAHIFSRVYCRKADEEFKQTVVKPSSSIVFLPPMPQEAAQILREHNTETLNIYKTYVETFVQQHIHEEDNTLPMTKFRIGTTSTDGASLASSLPATKVRSPFVALSGSGDEFKTVHDLCDTTRSGVFLEEAVIPHLPVYPDEDDERPINAWLLDFFKHGDVHTLEKANGIRRADIWFMLNDFSMALATIVTSLQNFMRLSEGTDLDMLDVMGDFDTHEEEKDDKVAADEAGSEVSAPSVVDSVMGEVEKTKKALPVQGKKRNKNVDSWEDVADAEAAADDRANSLREAAVRKAKSEQEQAEEAKAAAALSDEGLKDVLLAFQKLHAELTVKFKAMWA